MLITQDAGPLLIIAAYRDNEVDVGHPLEKLIREVRENEADRITEVKLKPLTTAHITSLLVDSFRCSPDSAHPFAQLLFSKTQGNPFFLSVTLRSFYESGLLQFNFGNAKWEWQLEEMRLTAVASDVVAVLCEQMATLSPSSQLFLQFAACSGATFNMHAIAVVTQMPLSQLVDAACTLVHEGFVCCTSEYHELALLEEAHRQTRTIQSTTDNAVSTHSADIPALPNTTSTQRLSSINMRFMHDKIQAAAYQLIPAASVSQYHCTIARRLMHEYDEDERHEWAMEICGHMSVAHATRTTFARYLNSNHAICALFLVAILASSTTMHRCRLKLRNNGRTF